MAAKYDSPASCNKCGGRNRTIERDSIENIVTEYSTYCADCGHEDYWVTEPIDDTIENLDETKYQ